ncbi:helix-turn-helix domain-containing protein [Streptococcus sp. E17BB]|uniref:helix-turn-helix domain-containing protein n=1 Tax=Streptococcus sp. E17BB TaxID=3278714 RepID=UPI00359D58B5
MKFGKKVKALRQAQKITKEAFCGDESELSVRQLTRIETGKSTPTLAKVQFIASRLGVKIGDLTDESFELPARYKELKYLLLRTQTYQENSRLEEKETYLNEIYDDFYDELSEEEQLVIDIIDTNLRLGFDDNFFSANKILEDYLDQLFTKNIYTANDLVLIDLYLLAIKKKDFPPEWFDKKQYNELISNLFKHVDIVPLEDLSTLNSVFISVFSNSISLNCEESMGKTIAAMERIMQKTQDFQKMPIFNLMKWKYYLFQEKNEEEARLCYENACMFARLVSDKTLLTKLSAEWKQDIVRR